MATRKASHIQPGDQQQTVRTVLEVRTRADSITVIWDDGDKTDLKPGDALEILGDDPAPDAAALAPDEGS